MKRIVLFSMPTEKNIKEILALIFPKEIKKKVFAYMPSDGAKCPQKYFNQWKEYAKEHEAKFRYIDNSKVNSAEEKKKLFDSSILVITGGNTFILLHNLRHSRLDVAIKEFANKKEFVLVGFSAGALVLTPTIKICNLPGYDPNLVGIKDLTGLNIVDFEVFPHYSEAEHKKLLQEYKSSTKNEVRAITDEGHIVIDR